MHLYIYIYSSKTGHIILDEKTVLTFDLLYFFISGFYF